MAINKFVDRQGNTLLDLSADSVSPSRVLAGTTYHGPDGLQHTGTLDPGPLDYSQYNFIDYDGTLLYSYTDEELDALEALPAGPDHTADNLTFQEWNWTLADLKAWDRTRPDRPLIGANLITTDGKTYIELNTPLASPRMSFGYNGTLNSVDWGDGTVDTNTSHNYSSPGSYTIIINTNSDAELTINVGDDNRKWITGIKIGNLKSIIGSYQGGLSYLELIKKINIPKDLKFADNGSSSLQSLYNLNTLIIPKNTIRIYLNQNYNLKNLSLPKGLTYVKLYECYSFERITLPEEVTYINFDNLYNLKFIEIPDGVTELPSSCFSSNFVLSYLFLSDSIIKIGSGSFSNTKCLTLDLSKQSKVITLTESPYFGGIQILVPSSLLEQYKSASYWSDYASIMVGV